MPQTIPRVERKRRSENCLAGVLGGVGEASDKLDDVGTVESAGCKKVSEREPIENWVLRH
jgi:hypothetical protein